MNSQDALERLKKGNENYTQGIRTTGHTSDQDRKSLTSGQSPYAIILSCADSRVAPELIFDAGIGELFVIRVAGNIPNTSSIASIEYAVAHLGTQLIVVMGHQSCGAVQAAVKGGDLGANLNHLIGHIQPAVNKLGNQAPLADVIKENAMQSAEGLKQQSTIISEAVQSGKVEIVPAYYHLDSGKVDF